MADWVGKSTTLLKPGNKKTKTARIWAYVRDERPWSGQSPPCVWYQFTVDRKGEYPVSHQSGYQGWVHADGYAIFNGAFGNGKASKWPAWPISGASSSASSRPAVPLLRVCFCFCSMRRLPCCYHKMVLLMMRADGHQPKEAKTQHLVEIVFRTGLYHHLCPAFLLLSENKPVR